MKKSLVDHMGGANLPPPTRRKSPLWRGPWEDGITFSLLSRFLSCRERFRLLVVEGLKSRDIFNHRLEYGSMWHICEEHYESGKDDGRRTHASQTWDVALQEYVEKLVQKYPLKQEEIIHWYNVCYTQFQVYLDYWSRHPDVQEREVLLPEVSFKVPYKLPSSRVVLLRGKWDSVDLIGKGKSAGVFLQENKTKGDINERLLQRQLTWDLQTMLYAIALESLYGEMPVVTRGAPPYLRGQFDPPPKVDWCNYPIRGVRYNVVRRPLSGGKGTIIRHKPSKSKPRGESAEEYYERLGKVIRDDPEHFFMRWKVEITPEDILRFRKECLDPILETLLCWWDAVTGGPTCGDCSSHLTWRHPYGVWNPIDQGYESELDEYLYSGSEAGLTRTDNLFPELDNA